MGSSIMAKKESTQKQSKSPRKGRKVRSPPDFDFEMVKRGLRWFTPIEWSELYEEIKNMYLRK
jgi:hypothetical protein